MEFERAKLFTMPCINCIFLRYGPEGDIKQETKLFII